MTKAVQLEIVPITFKVACAFVAKHHRHNKPPQGMKFCVCVQDACNQIRGVAVVGRPVARHFDDGRTAEITRTCTDGARNANSMLYGACTRAAKALGYRRIITYIQAEETGASLRAAGFVMVKSLPARGSWAESSRKLRSMRDPVGNGGVERQLWEWRR